MTTSAGAELRATPRNAHGRTPGATPGANRGEALDANRGDTVATDRADHLEVNLEAVPRDAGQAVVIGSGIAGLTAALELGNCTLVTKTALGAGASRLAQGGIAAALGLDDTPSLHANDTVAVGGGLSNPHVAGVVADAAVERIEWLTHLGARFDTGDNGTVALGREAGHGQRRIVHADGDATGAEVMRTLVAAVANRPDIVVRERTAAIDLVRRGNRVAGVAVRDAHPANDAASHGNIEVLTADAVVLATGGVGRLYAHTTNPAEATGDGLAMALRAGAQVQDPEFVQFHPTALASTLDPMPLLTEALRGEGAQLVDASGRRYLVDVHPDAELAPRDVVARANWHEQQSGPIYLDVRMIDRLAQRFPTVHRYAVQAGLDPTSQPLPVSPAQHYHMGGVATDDAGRTSLDGLYACGEVAATGLHGANRLASNSLIEGLVLGRRVAHAIATASLTVASGDLTMPTSALGLLTAARELPDAAALAALRKLMWLRGGLVREEAGLTSALKDLPDLAMALARTVEGRNLVDVAEVVLRAALAREESRGSHYRRDYPAPGATHGEHTVLVLPEPTTTLEMANVAVAP